MKNKYFSAGIYTEGLKRLRLMGFIVFAIYLVNVIFPPILTYAFRLALSGIDVQIVDLNTVLGGLWLVPYLVVPIMTLIIFGGYNKRKFSDFHHSLPYTRNCTFLSNIAAILTWGLGLMASVGTVNVLIYLVFPSIYEFRFTVSADVVLSLLIVMLLTTASHALGCAVTGKGLANFVSSVLILYLPRLIITMFYLTVTGKFLFLAKTNTIFFLSIDTNVYFGYVASGMQNLVRAIIGDSSIAFTYGVWSYVYSFALALAMGVLAAVMFKRRKSETSGQSASSKKIQALIRCGVPLLFSALGTMIIVLEPDAYAWSILLYVLAILAFFIYELLSTKRWKSLLGIMRSLGVLVLINLCFYCAVFGIGAIAASFKPEPAEIQYVKVLPSEEDAYELYGLSDGVTRFHTVYDFAEVCAENVEIKSGNAIDIIGNALKSNIDMGDKLESYYQNGRYYRYEVVIKAGGTERYRSVYLTNSEKERLFTALNSDENYKSSYTSLPERKKGTEVFVWDADYLYGYGDGNELYRNLDWDRVFDCMQEEAKEMGISGWKRVLTSYHAYYGSTMHGYIVYSSNIGEVVIPITYGYTPKTYTLLKDLCGISAK